MKKMYFALLMLGLILASCGGDSKNADRKEKIKDSEYTRDKDEALELGERLIDLEKKMYKEAFDSQKGQKEKKDELLKDYDDKESELIKMAKTGDEDALDALTELRELDFTLQLVFKEVTKNRDLVLYAFQQSCSDIRELNEADDLKDWQKDIDKIAKKRAKASENYNEKISELLKD